MTEIDSRPAMLGSSRAFIDRVNSSHARGILRRSVSSTRRAFTLIECIAAIIIISIAIPPMLWSMREGHVQRVNPMLASKARWLATEKLETIIADRHSTTRGYPYLVTANYAAEVPVSGSPGFSRSVSFTQTAANLSTAGVGYMRVTVTVTWTDATATSRSLSIATLLTDY